MNNTCRSHRKLQAPTRLIETIESQKVNKPPKKRPHPKAFVAQQTLEPQSIFKALDSSEFCTRKNL